MTRSADHGFCLGAVAMIQEMQSDFPNVLGPEHDRLLGTETGDGCEKTYVVWNSVTEHLTVSLPATLFGNRSQALKE